MKFQVHIPFVEMLGFELCASSPARPRSRSTLRDELTNSWGVAHGGVTMTLLDVVMAHAARTPRRRRRRRDVGVVTIEMKTTFLRPGLGRAGRHAAVACTAPRRWRSAKARSSTRDGKLVAHATGTFKYLKGLPAGGKRIQRLNASD